MRHLDLHIVSHRVRDSMNFRDVVGATHHFHRSSDCLRASNVVIPQFGRAVVA